MESNHRYWARRAVEEQRAAARSVTEEGRARRRALAEAFMQKAQLCLDEPARDLVHPWRGMLHVPVQHMIARWDAETRRPAGPKSSPRA